jgi:hypothetical protein
VESVDGKPHHEKLCTDIADKSDREKSPPVYKESPKKAEDSSPELLSMDSGVIILPTISLKVKGKQDWVKDVALLDSRS